MERDTMKKLYMIGNTHFDPVWLWQWDEALSSITATFRAALARMDEYEDFKYSFSAPAVLEWIRNTDEELFDEIKKRVAEGRWELCEGWWLQADCNGALGESYVRQGLYAQKYFEKHFGKKSRTVFNIDSFGHPGSLVQIMAGCEIENYAFWRPNEAQKHIDTPLFYWDGENNTVIKTYRIGGAGGDIFNELNRDVMESLFGEDTIDDLMVVYGVTDHGGAPTIRSIEEILVGLFYIQPKPLVSRFKILKKLQNRRFAEIFVVPPTKYPITPLYSSIQNKNILHNIAPPYRFEIFYSFIITH